MSPEPGAAEGVPLPYPAPALPEEEIVVLPILIEGEVGIYPNGASMLVKELRAAGIPARYLHDADHRQWQVHMGEVPLDLIIGVASGLISTGIWATFAHLVGDHFPKRLVNLHLVRQNRKADGSYGTTTVDLSGTGPQLQELLATALQQPTPDDDE